ncbi:hypothetical protein XANCAGTX0491_002094 [Xanthoria calcicola]
MAGNFLRYNKKVPTDQGTALVQSWLYFAFLREFIGLPFDSRICFMQEFDDRQWVSTINLDQMLAQWADRLLREHKDGGGEEKLATLEQLLSDNHETIRWLQTPAMELGFHSILLSIAVLGERLRSALAELRDLFGLEIKYVKGCWRAKDPTTDLGMPIIDLLGYIGWCPYDVGRIDRETEQISALYYYSYLKAPRSNTDHSSCSRERCSSMATDPTLYKPKHRRGDCECQMMSADPEQVANILLQGSIPLVCLNRDPESGISKAMVRPLMDGQTFVAISHVWAEGAGNAYENALQCCMMEDIEKCVRQLPWQEDENGFPFWIDTLCVPVGPPALKTLALHRMRVPYERAEHVIVLDSHLRSLESSELSFTELVAQVSCSSWMRRLWTLQEGRLAKRLWFQFGDKAVDVRGVFGAHGEKYLLQNADLWMALCLYNRLHDIVGASTNRAGSFRKVTFGLKTTYLSLHSRSVSIPTDEALCLFTLMGLDIAKVTAVPPLERMNVFWRTFNSVPASFFFSKAPRKLLEPGLRWAPSSFMQCESAWSWLGPQLSEPTENDIHAVRTNEGLLAPLPGLLFRANIAERVERTILTKDSVFLLQAKNGAWLRVFLEEPWNHSAAADTTLGLAIILAFRCDSYLNTRTHSHLISIGFYSRASSPGVLVSRRRTENGIKHVTGLNHVDVILLGESEQKLRSMIRASLRDANVSHDTFMALETEHDSSVLDRCSIVAQALLSNEEFSGLLVPFARHVGNGDTSEDLVEVLMGLLADAIFYGDCCDVQELPESQQWCID